MERQSAVTHEISRTVTESSHAAREVASQIVHVSNEAVETERRATEIRDASAEIADKVNGLREALVRVVRTSTADVNRRIFARADVECRATIEAAGRLHQVVVRNLSEGGALIVAALPNVQTDTPLTLTIEGIPAKLTGVVVRLDKNTTSIEFKLPEAAEKLVGDFIRGRRAA